MNGLAVEVERYLTIRRSVGFKLARAEKLLADYLRYLDKVGDTVITVDTALTWACLPADGTSNWRGHRLSVVRAFARHLHAIDATHQVPPAGLLPSRSNRAVPYLYSHDDIAALMVAARALRSPLRAATFETLVGLLAVTGMRIGEALRLDRDDIDVARAVIHVRQTKFGKSRDIPVHPTTIDTLITYAQRRDELCPHPRDRSLFVSLAGTRLLYCNVHLAWLGLVRHAGLTPRPAGCRPRPHDLRHAFATHTVLDWYRNGADVAARMPMLSTYLGHIDPAATYWYLSAAPELLALAAGRLGPLQSPR